MFFVNVKQARLMTVDYLTHRSVACKSVSLFIKLSASNMYLTKSRMMRSSQTIKNVCSVEHQKLHTFY